MQARRRSPVAPRTAPRPMHRDRCRARGVRRASRTSVAAAKQQRRSIAAAVLCKGDLGLQQIHAGSSEFVQRAGLRGRQQPERLVERAGLQLGLCRRQHALGAAARVGRQVGRASQERCCGSEPPAGLRPTGGPLELRRDILVRASRGLRTVPGAAIRLERGVGHVRQRSVRALALAVRSRSIDGRPHQRMAEAHLRADLQKPGPGCGLDRGAGDPKPRRGAPHQRRVADWFRRRDQEQQPRLRPVTPRAVAGSSPRSGPTAAADPALRTRRPTVLPRALAGAPKAQADCRAPPRRSDPGRAHRAGPG